MMMKLTVVHVVKMFKQLGIEEDDIFVISGIFQKLRIHDNELQYHNAYGDWSKFTFSAKKLIEEEVRLLLRAPWRPKDGDIYYYIVQDLLEYGFMHVEQYSFYDSKEQLERVRALSLTGNLFSTRIEADEKVYAIRKLMLQRE